MKKCVTIAAAAVLAIWTASAQEGQKAGVYLGYDYVRFNSATNVPAFSANGGNGEFISHLDNIFHHRRPTGQRRAGPAALCANDHHLRGVHDLVLVDHGFCERADEPGQAGFIL